jgi:hypothetical protein
MAEVAEAISQGESDQKHEERRCAGKGEGGGGMGSVGANGRCFHVRRTQSRLEATGLQFRTVLRYTYLYFYSASSV